MAIIIEKRSDGPQAVQTWKINVVKMERRIGFIKSGVAAI